MASLDVGVDDMMSIDGRHDGVVGITLVKMAVHDGI